MSEPTKGSLYENGRSFDAYYYSFDPTGDYRTDVVLHAVAKAGKSYHSTEDWHRDCGPYTDHLRGSTPIEWIQNAATDAATASSQMQEQIKELRGHIEALLGYDTYRTEYDGKVYDLCPCCGEQDGEHTERCEFTAARAALANTERKTASPTT